MVFSKRALRTSKNNQDEHVSTCLHVWLMSIPKSLKRKVTQPNKPIHHVPSTPWLFTCQHLQRLHPFYSTLPGTQLQWPHFAARQHSHGLPQICPHTTPSTNSLRHLCRIQRVAASVWERHCNMASGKSQPLHHCIHMGRIIEDICIPHKYIYNHIHIAELSEPLSAPAQLEEQPPTLGGFGECKWQWATATWLSCMARGWGRTIDYSQHLAAFTAGQGHANQTCTVTVKCWHEKRVGTQGWNLTSCKKCTTWSEVHSTSNFYAGCSLLLHLMLEHSGI